jgi:hypothetical protein
VTDFLVYGNPSTVVADERWPFLYHSASDQYHRVAVGDCLWIVTSEGPDDLVLVGRQQVSKIVGQFEAEQLTATSNLWRSDYHAISDFPEEKVNLDISRYAPRLMFEGVVETLPKGFTGQHLQTMRRLYAGSATLLERLWARRHESDASETESRSKKKTTNENRRK